MGKRDKEVHFVMLEEEVKRMRLKIEELDIRSQSAYLRKMALDGYSVKLDLQDVKEMVSLLRRCSNNLNQYAKRANETGNIYEADIQDMQARLDEIWAIGKEILLRLSSIQ
ncbi:plasmid mobilization protein [Eubacterium ramulus]